MAKPIVPNSINYCNIYGSVTRHELLLNQNVQVGSSPTFGNLQVEHDLNVGGNLYVFGNTTVIDTNLTQFRDNILLLNADQTGPGVLLSQAGLEIDRGTLENVRIVWNEQNSRAEIGLISNLLPITLRESVPLSNGLMIWNPSTNLIESKNIISIPISFSNTNLTTSSTTGSIIIAGGIGLKSDLWMDGKIRLTGSALPNYSTIYTDPATNTLNLVSSVNISLVPSHAVFIPYNIPLTFGSDNQYILANSLTSRLTIGSDGDINLTPSINHNVNIPNQIPLTFSTPTEQIYTDSNNNIIIASSQDVYLYPNNGNANGKKVFIPVNTPLVYSNINQSISANLNNDLIINAGNNILLNPGQTLNVKLPTNNGLIFGCTGYQRIYADSSNMLNILSESDLNLNSSSYVNIPSNIPLTFSNYLQSLYGDTNGNLYINADNQVNSTTQIYISNNTNSTCATNGSIHTNGGLGVSQSIICESNITINSQNPDALRILNNSNDLLIVNASNTGKISVVSGDGTSSGPSIEISDTSLLNAQSLIQFNAAYDTTPGYMIGRGTILSNSGRLFTFNLPSYSAYSNTGPLPRFSITSENTGLELFSVEADTGNIQTLGNLGLANTDESYSPDTGSLVVKGGLGVIKSIYTSGKIITSVNSNTALQIQDGSQNILFNIDSINDNLTINQNTYIQINNNTSGFTIVNNSNTILTTILNIDTLNSILTTNLQVINSNNINSTNTSNGSFILSGGAAIQKNVNIGGNVTINNGLNMLNTNIINIANPNNPYDAANKAYVDLVKQGLYVKDSVVCATIHPQNLVTDFIPGNDIDGYTLELGDRILLLNQNNGIENGIYIVTNGPPIRPDDFQSGIEASGDFVFVKQGTINASLGFICNSISPNDIIDSNVLNFTEFTGLGQVQPGLGLSKNFNEININVDDFSIEINASNNLQISSSCVSTGLTGGSGLSLETSYDQSHVTMLGTITSGVWHGDLIPVPYGGTGQSIFNPGNIIFGNGTSGLINDSNLYYDTINVRLGLGTDSPSKDFELKSSKSISILLNSDSDANNPNANPEIILSYSATNQSYLAMTRQYNQYANGIYSDALVLSNNQTDNTSIIQFATNQNAQVTILANGNVGINTTNPSCTLQIIGTLDITDLTTFDSPVPSTSATQAAVVITGGLSISEEQNSSDLYNGGALTVAGGASIYKDLYIGGNINAVAGSSNTFSYLTITATDESINFSTGCLVTFGGITIQCTETATSLTNGGSFLTAGGASINGSLYVGQTINALQDTYLQNLYFTSNSNANYIESPDILRDANSFIPIYFTQYNNTSQNILTIHNCGLIIENNYTLQIGGNLQIPDGYKINYTTNNLNIIPNNTNSNYNINIGTIGSFSNLNIYGNAGGQVEWQSTNSNLLLNNSTIQLNKNDSSGSIVLSTPTFDSVSYINASGSNMILSLGGNSTGGQLITILSNDINTSSITFTPNNITSSTLILTNNIYSTFNGPANFTDRVEYSGNALHQTINNTNGNSLWIYCGQINTISGNQSGYCEIEFNNGININSTSGNNISGLKLNIAINNTTCIASHQHYGNILYNSNDIPICYIYQDTNTNYQLFLLTPPTSQTNINVKAQKNTKILLQSEGINTLPNGIYSNFNGITWTQTYKTNIQSTLKYTTGDLTVEGQNLSIASNLPIIGYNNNLTINERDIGTLYQRYQIANDSGLGDIVCPGDAPAYIDSIPSQIGVVDLLHLKLSSLASTQNDYYNGYWIKIITGTNINQIRQIIAYDGSQQVITIATPFTLQLPNTGTTINFYNNNFVANFFDVRNDTFALGYTNINPGNDYLNITDDANLRLKSLYSTDTTISTNSTSGAIYILGGISIANTNNAVSSTYGGSITTAGGVGIQRNLLVGENIGIGGSGFNPQENIHIRNQHATTRFENNTGQYSYIDFMENSTGNRYGILLDSTLNEFAFTYTTSGQTPNNANKAFTIDSTGQIGIQGLTLDTENFILTNSTTGYLGLMGADYNTNDNSMAGRILLFANSQTTNISAGSVNIYAGNVTNGNVSIFTNNDIERLRIDNNGTVNILATTLSDSSTNGSLITNGGISVFCSENATSLTSGGAITTTGGVAIKKDVYIGGSLFVTGTITVNGALTSPSLTCISFTNCSLIETFNVNLLVNGSIGILTFAITLLPINASQNTEVLISLPSRTNAFIKPFEVVSNASGYYDNTNIIPLMNVLTFGEVGFTNLCLTFQSASTGYHYFQVQATYILA